MKTKRSRVLNGFFILAFILAGVSSACAFISGKSGYIQICASDGSSKTIKILQDDDAYVLYALLDSQNNQNEELPSQESGKKGDCGFCFANTHLGKTVVSSEAISHVNQSTYLTVGAGSIAFKSAAFHYFQSRGPPLFI